MMWLRQLAAIIFSFVLLLICALPAHVLASPVSICGSTPSYQDAAIVGMEYSRSNRWLVVGYENHDLVTFDENLVEISRVSRLFAKPSLVAVNEVTQELLMVQGSEAGAILLLLDSKSGSAMASSMVDSTVNTVKFSSESGLFYVLSSSVGAGVWQGATVHVLNGRTLDEVWSKEIVGFNRQASDMVIDEESNTLLVTVSGKYPTLNALMRYDLATRQAIRAIHFEASEGFPPNRIGLERQSGRVMLAMGTRGNRVVDLSEDTDRPVPYDGHVIPDMYPVWFGDSHQGLLYGVARTGEGQISRSIVAFDLVGVTATPLAAIDPGYSLFAMSASGKDLYAANVETGMVTHFCLG